MNNKTNCESCFNYVYDEDSDCYECKISLDEDEMEKYLTKSFRNCPYYQYNDEYIMVRKQI